MEYKKASEQQIDNLFSRLKELGVDRVTAVNAAAMTLEKAKMDKMLDWPNQGNPMVNEICAKSREIAREDLTE